MSLDIKKLLENTDPFSFLPEREIGYISEKVLIDYVPRDTTVIEEGERPEYAYLIIKGAFILKKDGNIVDFLEEGDFFGDTALIFNQSNDFTVKSVEDSIVLLFPAELFLQIVNSNPEIKEYFTKTTIKKLSEAYTERALDEISDVSILPVSEFPLKPPVFCIDTDTVPVVAKKMSEKNISYCLVGDENKLKGIITDKDLKEKVLAKNLNPKDVYVEQIKSYPVETISDDNFVFEAVLKMIQKNIKRLPVLREGKVIGVIEDRDIFIKQSKSIVHLASQIDKAREVEELREIYFGLEDTVSTMFKTGKDIEILQKYISEINDRFVKKAVKIALNNSEINSDFVFMVLGSEGRKEQTINTDIDNCIVYLNENEKDKFLKLGEKIINILLKIGFPECPGKVMASNPEWNMSYEEWKRTVSQWISHPDPVSIMNTSIFFDFRAVWGRAEISENLRRYIFNQVEENKNFLVVMAMKNLEIEPPIGFFRDFIVEKSGEHTDELDIKKGGIFPIVHGIRILSLENKVFDTNTIDRIRKLKNKIGQTLSEELIESFKFMQNLRLKFQLKKLSEGKSPDNYIKPKELTKLEKDLLKDAFKVVKRFQEMVGVHFRLRV
ncbi:cyclic nucleotide-binding/CBS domain-containing protein [Persephonella atlantica]|uniref:Cyclic nucleotide-binding/CBS domain-containing protein n=1 Tax=Persephonella atlantica TaxID=2699429 RepID=A0ABS1GHZ9_9AQUI|nr:putative nucleotidyltransferase substrate binding domain-containing protein [Persephonella atlantica]MBK3332568.1 cyclic nucleotide-binding/CBS domain-containing protein [Persephonella atlantica]